MENLKEKEQVDDIALDGWTVFTILKTIARNEFSLMQTTFCMERAHDDDFNFFWTVALHSNFTFHPLTTIINIANVS